MLKNPKQISRGGTFTQVSEEKLSKKVYAVRVPESAAMELEKMAPVERTEFLREAIVAALNQR